MFVLDGEQSPAVANSSDDFDDKRNLLRTVLANSGDNSNRTLKTRVNNFIYNRFVAAYANAFTAAKTTTTKSQISSVASLTYDDDRTLTTLSSIIPVPVWNGDYYDYVNNNNAVRATTVTPPSPATTTTSDGSSPPATFLSHRLVRRIASSSASYFFNNSNDDGGDDNRKYFDLSDIYRQHRQHSYQHRHHRHQHTSRRHSSFSATAPPAAGAQLPLDSSDALLDEQSQSSDSTTSLFSFVDDEATNDDKLFEPTLDFRSLNRNQHVYTHAVLTKGVPIVDRLKFKSFESNEQASYIIDDVQSDLVSALSESQLAPPSEFLTDEQNNNIVSVDVVSTPWTNIDDDADDNLSDTSKSLAILRDRVFDSKQQFFIADDTPELLSYDFELINTNSTALKPASSTTDFDLKANEAGDRLSNAIRRKSSSKYYPFNHIRNSGEIHAQNHINIFPPSSSEKYFVSKNPSTASFYEMVTTMVDSAVSRNGTTISYLPSWATATSPSSIFPQLSASISDDSFKNGINNSTASDLLEHFADSNLDHSHSAVRASILGVIFILMIVVTVVGNLFVIAAVYYERPLRKMTCNYYIVSLAVSDLMLGALIVPFSALYEVTGEWVFGDIWCTLWLSLDVLATTSSILGLMVISVDRYLAVKRPLNYYRYSSTRFVLIAVVSLWALSMLITTAPVFGFEGIVIEPVSGRVQCNVGGGLVWTLYSAVGSFFFPLTIMVVLNLRIYKIAERQSAALHEEFKRLQHIYSHLGPPEVDGDTNEASIATIEKHATLNSNHHHNNNDGHNNFAANDSAFSTGPATTNNSNNGATNGKIDEKNHNSADGVGKHPRSSDTSLGAKARSLLRGNHVSTRSVHKMRRFSKQHRAAKTLSFIMACFTVCFVPFFTIYLIEGIATHWNVNLIGPIPFKVAFWLGYFNSALNPFIYAVSNRDFRRAFQKLFHCYYCRDYSDWHDMMRKPSWALYHRPSSSVTERTRLQQQRQQQLRHQSTAYSIEDGPPASPDPAAATATPYIDFGSIQKQQDEKPLTESINNNSMQQDGVPLAATTIGITGANDTSAVDVPPASTARRQSTPDHQRVAVTCEELRHSLTTTTLPALQTIALSTAPFSRRLSSSAGVIGGRADMTTPQSNVHSQLSVESPYIISSLEHHQHRSNGTSSRAKQKRPSIVVSPENANEMALAIYVGDEYDKEFFRSFAADDDEDDEDEDNYEGSYSLRPHHPTTAANRQGQKQHSFGKRRQISAPTSQSNATTTVHITGASPKHDESAMTLAIEAGGGENSLKTTPRRKLSATITASASFLIRTLQGHRHQRSDAANRTRRVSFSDHSIPAQRQRTLQTSIEANVGSSHERRRNLFWNSEPDQVSSDLSTKRRPNSEDDGTVVRVPLVVQHHNNKFTATASRLARSLTMPVKFRKSPTDAAIPEPLQSAQKMPAAMSVSSAKQTDRISNASPPHSNSQSSAVQHERNFSDASDSGIVNSNKRSPSPFPTECPRCELCLQNEQLQHSIEESPASIIHGAGEPIKIHGQPPTTHSLNESHNHLTVQKAPTACVLVCSVGINTEPVQLLYDQFGGPSSSHSNSDKHTAAQRIRPSGTSTSNNLSSGQQLKAKQCGVQTSYSVLDMGSF